MTRIDFYLLSSAAEAARLDYACRLAHKAWSKGHQVYLHCADEAQVEALDELLWSFRADAFVPHGCDPAERSTPVICSCAEDPGNQHDLLINLSNQQPGFFSRFHRMAEIIVEHDSVRLPARERFRFYRDKGYALQTHQIRTAE
jgi:DNA polymerase-3 subunit chi